MKGSVFLAAEEEPPGNQQHWEHKGKREFEDVAQEGGRMRVLLIRDGFDHEIRTVPDIGVGAEEDRADAESLKTLESERLAEDERHLSMLLREAVPGGFDREIYLEGRHGLVYLFGVRSTRYQGYVGAMRLHMSDESCSCIGSSKGAGGCAQKTEVGGGIVQHAGECPTAPEEEGRARMAKLGRVALKSVERGHHGSKDAGEQDGDLLDWVEIEIIGFMH